MELAHERQRDLIEASTGFRWARWLHTDETQPPLREALRRDPELPGSPAETPAPIGQSSRPRPEWRRGEHALAARHRTRHPREHSHSG
jgi:hypothetical protein